MLIDTHAHLNFNAYKEDLEKVIKRTLDNNVWMINVGSQYETSKKALEIAERYPEGVYATVGLHPIHLAEGIFKVKLDEEEQAFQTKNEDFDYEKYKNLAVGKNLDSSGIKNLAKNKKVVAIGETGFDYYYRPKTKIKLEQFKQRQKEVFLKHLDLAQELNLPVIFHCRMAHQDLIEVLNSKFQITNSKLRGVVHCFTGNWEQAQQYLEMGFYLGFNGIIFKLNLDDIIKKTPLERILVETDCPYLIPPLPADFVWPKADSVEPKAEALAEAGPMKGRNEPIFVKYVAERIAEIKKISYEEISRVTTENAQKLFKIH